MLTVLAQMLFSASGQQPHRVHGRPTPDTRAHWAGRFDGRERFDSTRPPYRYNRFKDLW